MRRTDVSRDSVWVALITGLEEKPFVGLFSTREEAVAAVHAAFVRECDDDEDTFRIFDGRALVVERALPKER